MTTRSTDWHAAGRDTALAARKPHVKPASDLENPIYELQLGTRFGVERREICDQEIVVLVLHPGDAAGEPLHVGMGSSQVLELIELLQLAAGAR